MLECLVQTIATVLSSSISCQVFRLQKDEVLQVGSSFSHQDCTELIEACADIVGKLEGHGEFVELLLGIRVETMI